LIKNGGRGKKTKQQSATVSSSGVMPGQGTRLRVYRHYGREGGGEIWRRGGKLKPLHPWGKWDERRKGRC